MISTKVWAAKKLTLNEFCLSLPAEEAKKSGRALSVAAPCGLHAHARCMQMRQNSRDWQGWNAVSSKGRFSTNYKLSELFSSVDPGSVYMYWKRRKHVRKVSILLEKLQLHHCFFLQSQIPNLIGGLKLLGGGGGDFDELKTSFSCGMVPRIQGLDPPPPIASTLNPPPAWMFSEDAFCGKGPNCSFFSQSNSSSGSVITLSPTKKKVCRYTSSNFLFSAQHESVPQSWILGPPEEQRYHTGQEHPPQKMHLIGSQLILLKWTVCQAGDPGERQAWNSEGKLH